MLPDCAARHHQWRRLFEDAVGVGGSGRRDAVAFISDELDSIDSRARAALA